MSAAPAADHVLRMLTLLSRHPEPVSAGMVAATLQLPRSSTYRLLSTLVDHGFVHYLPEERRYGLSVAAYELGSAYARQAPLQRIARPIVRQLVDRDEAERPPCGAARARRALCHRGTGGGPPNVDHRRRGTAAGGADGQRTSDARPAACRPGPCTVSERGGLRRDRTWAGDPHRAAPATERCPQQGIRHRSRVR